MKTLLGVLALTVLVGCQTVQPIKQTTSGRPEATFRDATAEEVSSKISVECLDRGIMVKEATSNVVVCGKTMEGGDAVLAQMLIGNSYSTTPEQNVRFNIIQNGNDVRVVAYQWIESQMAFGQVNRQELNGGNQFNEVQNLLYRIGGY